MTEESFSDEKEVDEILNDFGVWCFNKGLLSDLGSKANGSFQYKMHKKKARESILSVFGFDKGEKK